jgi:NADH-quinone oxidoreductase subunit N
MDKYNWLSVYPEIILLVMTCVIAVADLWVKDAERKATYYLTLATLAGLAFLNAVYFTAGFTLYGMSNMVVVDPLSSLLKCFASLAVLASLVYGRSYAEARGLFRGELFSLALFALLGQYVMVSGNNLLTIYLGLELMSLALYALVALHRDNAVATESAMKYFVLGALASGFLLYGMSLIYGSTGALDLASIFSTISSERVPKAPLVLGLVFLVSGLAFKLGVVPFHMWVPDVYQGSPTVTTLLIGGAPKLAAFALCLRILVEGLLPLALDWQNMLAILAICSIALGNLTALAQHNLKRMLAYSTISQMGFMLLGLMSGVVNRTTDAAANAYSSALFYSVAYVLTTLGTFGLIMLLSRSGHEAENISDFKGLNKRKPWYAAMMAMLLLSLAGIPPFIGFTAKLSVLQALLQTGQIWLVVFAVVFSLIGAYYYIRVIKVMYFEEPDDHAEIKPYADAHALISINALAVLVLGLFPEGVLGWCAQAIVRTLAS